MSELEQSGSGPVESTGVGSVEPAAPALSTEGAAAAVSGSTKSTPKWLIWTIVGMIGVAALAGTYYVGTLQAGNSGDDQKNLQAGNQSQGEDDQEVEASATPTPTPSATPAATPTPTKAADPYEGWQRFSSLGFADGYNFDFRYPSSWTFDASGKGSGCVLLFRPTEAMASTLCVTEQHYNGKSLQEVATQGFSSRQIAQRQDKTINGKRAIWVEQVPVMDTGGRITNNHMYIDGLRMSAGNQAGYLSLHGRFIEGAGSYDTYKEQFQLIAESVVLK